MRKYLALGIAVLSGCANLAMQTRVLPLGEPAPAKAPDAPIALYHQTVPSCAYTEVAMVTVKALNEAPSDAAMARQLQAKARALGGDAVVNVTAGSAANAYVSRDVDGSVNVEYDRVLSGTVVRYKAGTCAPEAGTP